MNAKTKNPLRLRVYAVGGFGINLGPVFSRTSAEDGFDHVDVVYVDTSDANMTDNRLADVPEENIFRFPKLNGGGKDRREMHPKIVPHIPDLLRKLVPQHFNIVLHSAGGASGSTVGPEIVREILRRGGNVVVVQVGSTSDRTVLKNTVGTLRSYAGISSQVSRPVISHYGESSAKTPPSKVDERALSALFLLSVLLSNRNGRVDATDLSNLLNYDRVTNFKPEFSSIEFFRDTVSVPEYVIPQAMALLVPEVNTDQLGVPLEGVRVEYISDGVMDKDFAERLGEKNLATLIYTGEFRRVVNALDEELAIYEQEAAARNRDMSSLAGVTSEDGMVF